jgi:tetratricopeptide (TPR) repeat protein
MVDAEKAYPEALSIDRDLAARDPGAYRADVASTLSNLGILYGNTGRMADAKQAYTEALSIYDNLAVNHPKVYDILIKSLTTRLAELDTQSPIMHR